jgi:sporulation-control protein spo0M
MFDSAKNLVSGNHCVVTIEKPAFAYTLMPVTVKIKAVAKQDFDCDGVYVDVTATETVSWKVEGMPTPNFRVESTYANKFKVANAFKMKNGETKEFTAIITLPKDCPVTYAGSNANHKIQIQARLDTKGNDPDSGFQDIKIGSMS